MTSPVISPDLTFTQADAPIILKDYVCAVCLSELSVNRIANEARIFIVCPTHGNVCLSGRVMRSTANMQVERSSRDYYPMIAAMPDLFAPIWLNGLSESKALDIQKHCVCALCGWDVRMTMIRDEKGKAVDNVVTISCERHGNVGLNGIGFVRKSDYVFIPPIKERQFLKARAGHTAPVSFHYESVPASMSFDKLGVVTYRVRPELADTVKVQDHFQIMFFGRYSELANRFKTRFGKEPKRLRIRIPSPIVQTSLDCYSKGALTARAVWDGDGWRWDYYRDPYTHEIEIRGGYAVTVTGLRIQQRGVRLDEPIYVNSKNKPFPLQHIARLRFVMPDLAVVNSKPTAGYFEMSLRDADALRIEEGVKIIKEKCFEQGKMLPQVPLILSLNREEDRQIIKLEME